MIAYLYPYGNTWVNNRVVKAYEPEKLHNSLMLSGGRKPHESVYSQWESAPRFNIEEMHTNQES